MLTVPETVCACITHVLLKARFSLSQGWNLLSEAAWVTSAELGHLHLSIIAMPTPAWTALLSCC